MDLPLSADIIDEARNVLESVSSATGINSGALYDRIGLWCPWEQFCEALASLEREGTLRFAHARWAQSLRQRQEVLIYPIAAS